MTFKLTMKENDHWVDVTDDKGNCLYGYLKLNKQDEPSSYQVVGAKFNDAQFSKEPIRWRRNKRGAVSLAFYEWVEIAEKELYEQFFVKEAN